MSTFIENQNWRYATKKFDATKKISAEDLNLLKEAIRLSTSSNGLQLYKVFIIENQELRAKLLPAAYGQSQIVDASQVIVFANQKFIKTRTIIIVVFITYLFGNLPPASKHSFKVL
jgi:nitroreductase